MVKVKFAEVEKVNPKVEWPESLSIGAYLVRRKESKELMVAFLNYNGGTKSVLFMSKDGIFTWDAGLVFLQKNFDLVGEDEVTNYKVEMVFNVK